jgi:hypothetical protein
MMMVMMVMMMVMMLMMVVMMMMMMMMIIIIIIKVSTPYVYFWIVPVSHQVTNLRTATDLYTDRLYSNTEFR